MTNERDGVTDFILGCTIITFMVICVAKGVDTITGATSSGSSSSSSYSSGNDVNYILKAKDYVRRQLTRPATADFHEMQTRVDSTSVHLVVTAKNAFGAPETLTFDVPKSAL